MYAVRHYISILLFELLFYIFKVYKGLVAVRFTAAKGKAGNGDIALDDIVFR